MAGGVGRREPRRREPRVELRFARPADFSRLLPLVRAYFKLDGIRFEKKVVGAALERLLRRPSLGRIWIMRYGSRAVGYAVLTFNYDLEFGGLEGLVTDLYLRSEHRRRGLGRRVLALIRAYCRSAGIGTIELQVEEHNKDAREFYRRLGFKKLSRIVMSRDV